MCWLQLKSGTRITAMYEGRRTHDEVCLCEERISEKNTGVYRPYNQMKWLLYNESGL